MAKIKLIDLYDCVQSALVSLGTSVHTINRYRGFGFNPILRFFEQKGRVYYSKKIVDEFVSDSLIACKNNLISNSKRQCIRKVAAILDEYDNTRTIKWSYLSRYDAVSLGCKNFETILMQYCLDMRSRERYAVSTLAGIKHAAKHFLLYLEERGHRNLRRLTCKIVSAYIPIVAQRQPRRMHCVIHALQSFLEYLHENQYIDSEVVSALPRCPAKRKKYFVGFTRDEAGALIDSVPLDTNCNKRTLAIFMLAESTGFRAVDVVNLKLSDIDWRNKTISITQHKTGRPLTLPFENRVGDVLAEYILHDRPESDSPFVFLSARRPFRPISQSRLSATASKHIKLSGIGNNVSLRKGFHCFRRSIGTWLLEAEIPLAMISEILGHGHIDSTKPYLSTDLERLRECALGLEGIEIQNGALK